MELFLKANKKRIPVNSFDIFLIFFILIFLIAFLFRDSFTTENTFVKVVYSVNIGSISPEIADKFAIGDTILDNETNEKIGVIKAITLNDATRILKKDDKYNKALYPEHFDMILTIEASGENKNGMYFINGSSLLCYKSLTVKTKNITANGICLGAFGE